MSKTNKIILAIVILVVVGGGAFWGGMIYGKGQAATSAATARASFAGRAGRTGAGASGAGFVSGSIISSDANSITITPATGGSKIIFYSSTTQIGKMTSGTSADLSVGTNVSVTGTTNSDGSVTAQSIQIRPVAPQTPAQ